MQIRQNILLKDHTTFKIGGPAKYFVVVKNIEDLKQVVAFAKRKQLPVYILGGGSNLLVSDKGVNGLVIKMEITDRNRVTAKRSGVSNPVSGSNFVQIIAGAGETWDDFVVYTINQGLSGLENLSGIPGTVGASVVGNIGAYGTEVSDIVDWVEVFDIETKKIIKLKNSDCRFGYRDSVFKKQLNWIVLKIAYNLQKTSSKDLKEKRKEILQTRNEKLPNWQKIGTAGSFFKNPIITKNQLDKLLKKYPDIPYYKCDVGTGYPPKRSEGVLPGTLRAIEGNTYKIPVAYILDKILNLKGYKKGDAGCYKKHPLILINHKNATCSQIKNLAQKIQQDVKQKTGLDIDFEVVEW